MENQGDKKTNRYKKIIDETLKNQKLSDNDKRDIVKGVANSMRDELFGGSGFADALSLKRDILEADKKITDATCSRVRGP